MVTAGFRLVLCLLLLGAPLAATDPVTARTPPLEHQESLGAHTATAPSAGLPAPPTPSNNSSTRHERLDELRRANEYGALSQWFGTHLSSQLETSIINLSQSQYDRAQSLLGDDYNTQLGKLVDVAGKTAGTTDDQTADRLNKTKHRQQEYIETVQEYRETYRDYQAAKRAGNDTEVRRHARQLNRLAERVQGASGDLTRWYRILSTQTGANLAQGRQTVTDITQNITTQQTEVRRATFVNTSLTIQQAPASASFRDPLRVRGRLAAANGTTLADRRIVVQVGSRTIRTRTTANGSFAVTLRPRTIARGPVSVSVRFRPRPTAVYLGTNTTVPVTITPVTPTVTLTRSPTTVAYNDTLTVAGQAHVQNMSVGRGIPVRVAIGATVLGTTRTHANGTFRLETALPARAPAGDQDVRVTLPLEQRALGRVNTSRPISVSTTATQLTVHQVVTDEPANVPFQGLLTTTNGTPVAGQPIQLRVAGQTIATTTTNQTGHYHASLPPATLRAAGANGSVTVTAVYPGPGNLQPAQATTTVNRSTLAAGAGAGTGGGGIGALVRGVSWPYWVGALGGLAIIGLAVLARRYYLGDDGNADSDTDPSDTTPSATTTSDDTKGDAEPPATQSAGEALREHADTLLAAGETELAVRTAYTAVRQQVVEHLDWEPDRTATYTYWEFYHACRDHTAMSEPQTEALKRLTEQFERAQFTTTHISADRAREAVDHATTFLSTTASSSGEPAEENAERAS